MEVNCTKLSSAYNIKKCCQEGQHGAWENLIVATKLTINYINWIGLEYTFNS